MSPQSSPDTSVSVIIPFFRDTELLRRALASVRGQSITEPVEVIIIDDGSGEHLTPVMEEFPDTRLVSQDNSGPGPARNNGIAIARGEFIAFLDSDDYWHEDKLQIQVQAMRNAGASWSQHSYWVVDTATGRPTLQNTSHLSGDVRKRVLTSFRVQTSAIMIRHSTIRDSSLRFSDDRVGEDGYLYALLAEEYPLLAIPDALSFFTWHGSNAGGNAAIQLWSRARMWQRHAHLIRQNASSAVLLSYRWCALMARVLSYRATPPQPTKTQQALAIVLYFPAYLVLRVEAGRS